ncbi:MAG: hypothetical protein MZV64_13255 [Ignavibacteriales bacterium]|nr:hypothetical protein [Ignavibacteriales bacterium]
MDLLQGKRGDPVHRRRHGQIQPRVLRSPNADHQSAVSKDVHPARQRLAVLRLRLVDRHDHLPKAKKTLISHGGSDRRIQGLLDQDQDRTEPDIIVLENDYFRTDVGVKWCYDITEDIIDILAGGDVKEAEAIDRQSRRPDHRAGRDRAGSNAIVSAQEERRLSDQRAGLFTISPVNWTTNTA